MLKCNLVKESVVTALDFNRHWLKLAQSVPAPKGRKITELLFESVEGKGEEEIVKILPNLVSRLKVKPTSLITLLPLYSTITRFIKLPTAQESEIGGMVKYQLSRQSPYPVEEIIFGYRVIEINKQGYSQVMLAIVHRDIVNARLEILRRSNLDIRQVALSSEANSWWYRFNRQQGGREGIPVALVDIDCLSTDIMVIAKDKIIFSRGIVSGGDQLNKDPEALGQLVEELKRSFVSYNRAHPGKEIKKIVLSGIASGAETWKAKLAEELSREVEILPVFKNISGDKEVLDRIKDAPTSLSALIGLALGGNRVEPNLLPPAIKRRYAEQFKTKRLISNFGLSILLLLLGSFILFKTPIKERIIPVMMTALAVLSEMFSFMMRIQEFFLFFCIITHIFF